MDTWILAFIRRTARILRNPVTTYIATGAVICAALAFRLMGMTRSIWNDEAWVANSISAPSLDAMFYYDAWLQTSPPLFLILVRAVVWLFGLSPVVLRMVPFLCGVLAIVFTMMMAGRVLYPRFARVAWMFVALSPAAIRYSKTLKQYSLELATASALLLLCVLYLERRTNRRFAVLAAGVAVGCVASYSAVFLLPGMILAVLFSSVTVQTEPAFGRISLSTAIQRAIILAVLAGVVMMSVYAVFVTPNSSADLSAYWKPEKHDNTSAIRVRSHLDADVLGELFPLPKRLSLDLADALKVVIVGSLLLGFLLACANFGRGRRRWIELQLICGLPWILLILCDGTGLYPMVTRTSLFLLPATAVLLMSCCQMTVHFFVRRTGRGVIAPFWDGVLLLLVVCVLWAAVFRQPIASVSAAEEDVAGAIRFLRANAVSQDLLWVHASCVETFKLYAAMEGGERLPAVFGDTGWPCCPRGIPAPRGSGSEENVRRDVDRAAPPNFAGRVWLLYTKRAAHWRYVGLDEYVVAQDVLRQRGCSEMETPSFRNAGVSLFHCR